MSCSGGGGSRWPAEGQARRRGAFSRCALVATALLAGCTLQRKPAEPDGVTVTPPAEDGTRYVAVQGGPITSPNTLKRQWQREAQRTCQGDYMLIADEPGQTRRRGLVVQRMHEGFVRCLIEDEEIGGEPDGGTRARTTATRSTPASQPRATAR